MIRWTNTENASFVEETAMETGLNATISISSAALIGGNRNGSDWWYGSAANVATGSGGYQLTKMQRLQNTCTNTDNAEL